MQGQLAQVEAENSELEGQADNLRDDLRGFSEREKIQLEDIRKYDIAGLVGKNTSRNMAYLIFKNEIPIQKQGVTSGRQVQYVKRSSLPYVLSVISV